METETKYRRWRSRPRMVVAGIRLTPMERTFLNWDCLHAWVTVPSTSPYVVRDHGSSPKDGKLICPGIVMFVLFFQITSYDPWGEPQVGVRRRGGMRGGSKKSRRPQERTGV